MKRNTCTDLSFLRIFCGLLLLFSLQATPLLRAALPSSWPTAWEMGAVKDTSDDWWQVIRIHKVPGVRYYLQESASPQADDWNTINSDYGTGGELVYPLFVGEEPVDGQSPIVPMPPPAAYAPVRSVMLVIEKSSEGETPLSWTSLDDATPKRMILPGVTLDPVWDDFNSSHLYPHDGFFFGLSPRLGAPVSFVGALPSLGPIDTEMIGAFTAAPPDITTNITHSVANAAQHSGLPPASGDRAFYRVAADSNGDGVPDAATPQATNSGGSSLYPILDDAPGPTPEAYLEQTTVTAGWHINIKPNHPTLTPETYSRHGSTSPGGATDAFDQSNSYEDFKNAFDALSIQADYLQECSREILSGNGCCEPRGWRRLRG